MSPQIQLLPWFSSTTTKYKWIQNGKTNSVEKQKGNFCALLSTLWRLFFFKNCIFVPLKKPIADNFCLLSLDTRFSIRDNEWVRKLVWTSRWLIHSMHQNREKDWVLVALTKTAKASWYATSLWSATCNGITDYLKKCEDVVSGVWLKQYI